MRADRSPSGPWLLAGLVAATLLVYHGAPASDFIGDDNFRILGSEPFFRRGLLATIRNVLPDRPLLMLTIHANWLLGGLDPFGYKLASVALHAAFGCLLFRTLLLLPDPSRRGASPDRLLAFLVALLFLVHPVNSQAVLSVIQRGVILAALGTVGALACFARYEASGRRPWYLLALLCALAGVLAKQFAVTTPAILLLHLATSGGLRRRHAPLLLPFLLLGALPWLSYRVLGVNAQRPELLLGPGDYLLTQARVVFLYYGKLLWPSGLHFRYEIAPAAGGLAGPAAFAVAGHAAIVGAGFAAVRRLPLAGFGILAAYAALAAESGFFPIEDLAFEHRFYFPFAFLAIALYALLGALRPGLRRAAAVLLALLVAACSLATVHRVRQVDTYEEWALDTYRHVRPDLRNNLALLADLWNVRSLERGRRFAAELRAEHPGEPWYGAFATLFDFGRLGPEARREAVGRIAAFLGNPATYAIAEHRPIRVLSRFLIENAAATTGSRREYARLLEPVLRNQMLAYRDEPLRFEEEIAVHRSLARELAAAYRAAEEGAALADGEFLHYLNVLGVLGLYEPAGREGTRREYDRLAGRHPERAGLVRDAQRYYERLAETGPAPRGDGSP